MEMDIEVEENPFSDGYDVNLTLYRAKSKNANPLTKGQADKLARILEGQLKTIGLLEIFELAIESGGV